LTTACSEFHPRDPCIDSAMPIDKAIALHSFAAVMSKQQNQLSAPPPALWALENGNERDKLAYLDEIARIYEDGEEGKEEMEQFVSASHIIPEKYSISKLGLEQAIDCATRPKINCRPLNPNNPTINLKMPTSPRTPNKDADNTIEKRRDRATHAQSNKNSSLKRTPQHPRKPGNLLAAKVKSGQVKIYKAGVAFNIEKFKTLVETTLQNATLLDMSTGELVKHLACLVDSKPASASLKNGTAEAVTIPEDVIFDEEPVQLDHEIMKRLDKVWGDLDIAPMAQIDCALRYSWCGGSHNEHMELLLQMWENLRNGNAILEDCFSNGKKAVESGRYFFSDRLSP
jgi:hypothetical protein